MEFWGANNTEEADFMAQLLSNPTFPFPSLEDSFSLTSSELMVLENATNVFLPGSNYGNSMSMDSCFGGAKVSSSSLSEGQDMSSCNAILGGDEECGFLPENPRKRNAGSSEVVEKKRNVRGRKNQKMASPRINEEDGEIRCNVQSSSSCSEDEPLPALNSNGKVRAGRGSATDPQSIYTRKRRERINERLKILQKLVPNGTKVDISTMLAEAVQYVKFLQLQIKLLSSDDMWMYAPIAYNGINLGLDI